MSAAAAASVGLSVSHKWPRSVVDDNGRVDFGRVAEPLAAAESTDKTEPRPTADYDNGGSPFHIEIAARGTYVKLRGSRGAPCGGGLRGVVCGFSRASRKRLLDRLNQVPVDVLSSALFITLTFPDEYPDVAEAKRALRRFIKRTKRVWPKSSGVWRMERVPRCSGSHVGGLAPHFHVLLFSVPWIETRWLAQTWYESVGSGDERHLYAGTSVERVRTRDGAMHYAAKYMCKPELAAMEHTGRMWAVFGEAWLDVLVREFSLTRAQFYRLRRVLRTYVLGLWRARCSPERWRESAPAWRRFARAPGLGCTAYLPEPVALRLLAWCAAP
jgi:hypothetical protein